MSENEEPIKEYKVEQLEDVDFEKEQQEKSKNKKTKNIIILILGILLLAAVGFGAYYFIGRATPETAIEDFITKFNEQDFESIIKSIDLQGFYALTTTSDGEDVDETTNIEKYYTKFDARYKEAKDEEECKEFVETISKMDTEIFKELFKGIQMSITEIEEPILIQNTKGLYKVTAHIDMILEGETASDKYVFYVNKAGSEYKFVGGDIPASILYTMLLSEYYNAAAAVQ